MKKIIITSVLSCCIVCAFSQKKFKQFHFNTYNTAQDPPPLDFGTTSFGLRQSADGTIDINTKDSTVTITSIGATPDVYTIKSMEEEVKDKDRGYKYIRLHCADKAGTDHLAFVKKWYKGSVVFELYADRIHFGQYNCDTPKDY